MIDFSVLPGFLVATMVLMISPGPDMMFMVATGISKGRAAALKAVLGVSTGVLVWVILVASGLGALVTAVPAALDVIRVIGAGYLLYLGISTWRAAGAATSEDAPTDNLFKRGFIVNMTNPKVAIFFVAFFPQFLGSTAGQPTLQFFMLGLIFLAIGFAVDLTIGLSAGLFRDLVLRRPNVRHALDLVSGSVYMLLAIFLLVEVFGA